MVTKPIQRAVPPKAGMASGCEDALKRLLGHCSNAGQDSDSKYVGYGERMLETCEGCFKYNSRC